MASSDNSSSTSTDPSIQSLMVDGQEPVDEKTWAMISYAIWLESRQPKITVLQKNGTLKQEIVKDLKFPPPKEELLCDEPIEMFKQVACIGVYNMFHKRVKEFIQFHSSRFIYSSKTKDIMHYMTRSNNIQIQYNSEFECDFCVSGEDCIGPKFNAVFNFDDPDILFSNAFVICNKMYYFISACIILNRWNNGILASLMGHNFNPIGLDELFLNRFLESTSEDQICTRDLLNKYCTIFKVIQRTIGLK